MNNSNILSERLVNQKLSSSEFHNSVDVVRWFGAMQAQDFHAAKWALGMRMVEATNAAVEAVYNDGQILRTHLMRPTWHFVAAGDIRWLLGLTAPRVNIRCGPNYRKFELDAATFKRSNKVLTNALKGSKHRTRTELKAVLNDSGIAADDPVRVAHILLRAELDGVVCSGRCIGNQFTYALFDERVPTTRVFDREEALETLTRRYFTSHGPATLQDFIWWSGLTSQDANQGIALVEHHLRKELVQEKTYWRQPAVQTKQPPAHSAYLLPAYDEYMVAYKDRQIVFDPRDGIPVLTAQGLLNPTLIINGQVAGGWKRTIERNSMTITVNSLRALNKSEKLAISKAADRYASFLGLRHKLSIKAKSY